MTERRSRRDRSVVRRRTLFFPDDESGRPPAAGLALPGPMGLGHGSGFNYCWLPSTSRTLNCNVAKTVHKGPGRRRFPSLLLLRVERSSSTRRTFVSVRSPPRGHAHAAHVPPHPNAALPREPGFAVLRCAGCQSSPDVRDWASPVFPLTRVGTAVRCALSPCVPSSLASGACIRVPPLPPLTPGMVVVGTDEARLGTGFSRIRYATVRWHLLAWSDSEAPQRVSDPARMAAVSFRHFFVLQSFAPFIFRTEFLDLLPL